MAADEEQAPVLEVVECDGFSYTANWHSGNEPSSEVREGTDLQLSKDLFEAFRTRRTVNGQKAYQWVIAYPRRHESYFFQELGPEITDNMDDDAAVRQLVERMRQIGQGMKNHEEEFDDSTHLFRGRGAKKKRKGKTLSWLRALEREQPDHVH